MKPEVGMQFTYGSFQSVYTIERVAGDTIHTSGGTLSVANFLTKEEGGVVTIVFSVFTASFLIAHGGYWR